MWWKPWTWHTLLGFEVLRDPEWDEESVDYLLALAAVEADIGPHGIPMSRATAADAYFEASPIPTHDKAQKALAAAQKKYYDAWPDADRSGDLWTVEEIK